MELTRRQFIITGSSLYTAIAVPVFSSKKIQEINNSFTNFKNLTIEQVHQLDKYHVDKIFLSLLSSLLFAYAFNLFDLLVTLMLILITLVVLI